MAKSETPKTAKLTFGTGGNAVSVSVAEEQVEQLLAGGLFTRAAVRAKVPTDK